MNQMTSSVKLIKNFDCFGIFFIMISAYFFSNHKSFAVAEDCVVDGITLVSGDLPEEDGGFGIITSRNPKDCLLECLRRPKCNYWSHVSNWKRNCFLKAEAIAEENLKTATSGWIGPNCSEQADIDILFVTERKIPTKPQRQQKPVSRKRQKTSTIKNFPVSNIFKQRTTEVPVVSSECIFNNVAILAVNIVSSSGVDGFSETSEKSCAKLCQDYPQCQAWTFISAWKVNCYLKKTLGEKSMLPGAVSGVIRGPCEKNSVSSTPNEESTNIDKDEAPRPGECRINDRNFLGGGLTAEEGGQGIETPSASACSDECLKRPGLCSHWTYVKKWRVSCYLKKKLGQNSVYPGAISGTYGLNCNEINVPVTKPEEPAASKSSFIDDSGVMIIFPTFDEPGSSPKIPLSTNNKKQDNTNSMCILENTNYKLGDLSDAQGGNGLATTDSAACAQECRSRQSVCKYWTFVGKWKYNCYLKSQFISKESKEGYISGTIGSECETDNSVKKTLASPHADVTNVPINPGIDKGAVCIFRGVVLGQDSLSHTSTLAAQNVQQCAIVCSRHAECRYWTFFGRTRCSMWRKIGEPRIESLAISGSIGLSCV